MNDPQEDVVNYLWEEKHKSIGSRTRDSISAADSNNNLF